MRPRRSGNFLNVGRGGNGTFDLENGSTMSRDFVNVGRSGRGTMLIENGALVRLTQGGGPFVARPVVLTTTRS